MCRYESLEEVEVEVEAEHARSTQGKPENQILAELKQAVTIEVIMESRKVTELPFLLFPLSSIHTAQQHRWTRSELNLGLVHWFRKSSIEILCLMVAMLAPIAPTAT